MFGGRGFQNEWGPHNNEQEEAAKTITPALITIKLPQATTT